MMKHKVKYDLLRVFAIFGVIVIHITAYPYNYGDVYTITWKIANTYNTFFRWTVPVFFMLSGALLLNKEKINFKLFMSKYILKYLGIFILFTVLYAIAELKPITSIFAENRWKFIFLLFNYKYHLWFLITMIGVYLLYPIFMALKKYENGKYVIYYCVLFFVFGILSYSIKTINFEGVLEYIPTLFSNFNYELFGYSGYFLTGYYLSNFHFPKAKIKMIVAFLFIFLITITLSQYYVNTHGVVSTSYTNYFFIATYLESILVFLIFNSLEGNLTTKIENIFIEMSSVTVYVYLMHVFVIEWMLKYYPKTITHYNNVLVPFFSSLFVFGVCFLTVTTVKKFLCILKKYISN